MKERSLEEENLLLHQQPTMMLAFLGFLKPALQGGDVRLSLTRNEDGTGKLWMQPIVEPSDPPADGWVGSSLTLSAAFMKVFVDKE